ncbi:DEAD/DEAH box helicase family protein [Streptomyces anthocyanicus]|nr:MULTISPECIES: DEAD/DEAH box helicase family protein [Streptomyces]MCW8122465.1 DEAD/DEAH box helicase family protein [Streptomyces anthocyanicus]
MRRSPLHGRPGSRRRSKQVWPTAQSRNAPTLVSRHRKRTLLTTKPRPHQREAVDAVRAALVVSAASTVPERGLRTQVVMATGSGGTLVAAQSAHELRVGRVHATGSTPTSRT